MHGHCVANVHVNLSSPFVEQNIPSSRPCPLMVFCTSRLSRTPSMAIFSTSLLQACSPAWTNGHSPTLCSSSTTPQSTKLPASVKWSRNTALASCTSQLTPLTSIWSNYCSQQSRHGCTQTEMLSTMSWSLWMVQCMAHCGKRFTQSRWSRLGAGTSTVDILHSCTFFFQSNPLHNACHLNVMWMSAEMSSACTHIIVFLKCINSRQHFTIQYMNQTVQSNFPLNQIVLFSCNPLKGYSQTSWQYV